MRLIPALDFGGVESMVATQARLLDRRAFDFRVCTFWKAGVVAERLREEGIAVDELRVDPRVGNVRAPVALARYLRRHPPDILHAGVAEANLHAALVGKISGSGAVIIEEVGLPTRGRLGRIVFAGVHRSVDAIIAVSESVRRYLLDREHAPHDRVHVLYNCAQAAFHGVSRQPRQGGEPPVVLVVGRLVAVKNHGCLLRAFAEVLRAVPAARLRVAGDGPEWGALQALAAQLGVERNVEFLGFRNDVPQLMREADVFVLPSLAEGFAVAVVEAMASGLPVIASNVGGLPELMGDGGRRWLVDPTDAASWATAMVEILRMDPEDRHVIGRRAAERATLFSPWEHVRALEQLYRSVLGGSRRLNHEGSSRPGEDGRTRSTPG